MILCVGNYFKAHLTRAGTFKAKKDMHLNFMPDMQETDDQVRG